ncbi:MAG: hypothetical protein E6J87_25065 [Deltaproteobacteria bacterium]|nr:MAG: hypothetical protein E6J87_25065 [Deltaproteobacteria bacterium]
MRRRPRRRPSTCGWESRPVRTRSYRTRCMLYFAQSPSIGRSPWSVDPPRMKPRPAGRGKSRPERRNPPEPEQPAPLETYRRKRDPDRTPEPFGGAPAARAPEAAAPSAPAVPGARFVVQQHWARNLHFDLRLELEGVLKSWAVPKGPSVRAEEKRLAVHVEDHPLEYANFEGVIPAGNYGAGSVIVWDRGTYRSFKPEGVRELYERGKLELELFGHKLGGRWTLVRMSRSENDWLLLKKVDPAASDSDVLERFPRSVISGLTVQEMRDAAAWLGALRELVEAKGAPRGELRAAQRRSRRSRSRAAAGCSRSSTTACA